MCIRDRHEVEDRAVSPGGDCSGDHRHRAVWWDRIPVSYTHLDVYKRQVLGSPTEAIDTGVLEEAAHDGAHPDRLGELGDPRTQAAEPAHGQVDRHSRARGPVERIDHGGVGQTVQLEHDPPLRSRFCLLYTSRCV